MSLSVAAWPSSATVATKCLRNGGAAGELPRLFFFCAEAPNEDSRGTGDAPPSAEGGPPEAKRGQAYADRSLEDLKLFIKENNI